MRRIAWRAAGVALALAVMVATGYLTRWQYEGSSESEAELRLAWRARVPLVEECRRLTAAEQAELPAHMRREVVCEGEVASYDLEVEVDGRSVHRSTIEGAGARGDRPLYVFQALPLERGRHRVRVAFTRRGEIEGEHARRGAAMVPDRLVLDRDLDVESREVVLVTYDPEARSLVVR